jgi:hypothetical protein
MGVQAARIAATCSGAIAVIVYEAGPRMRAAPIMSDPRTSGSPLTVIPSPPRTPSTSPTKWLCERAGRKRPPRRRGTRRDRPFGCGKRRRHRQRSKASRANATVHTRASMRPGHFNRRAKAVRLNARYGLATGVGWSELTAPSQVGERSDFLSRGRAQGPFLPAYGSVTLLQFRRDTDVPTSRVLPRLKGRHVRLRPCRARRRGQLAGALV